MVEDGRAVLISIAVSSSRIAEGEEAIHELAIGYDSRIELHQHAFGMTGIAFADSLVSGVGRMTAGVAHFGRQNSLLVAELRLHSPKSTCGKACQLRMRSAG